MLWVLSLLMESSSPLSYFSFFSITSRGGMVVVGDRLRRLRFVKFLHTSRSEVVSS